LNQGETAAVSKRSADSALLVQGDTCVDSGGTIPVLAVAPRVKTINIGADATSGIPVDISGSAEVVSLDFSSGAFALASSSGGGIFVDLGGGGDQVNVLGPKSADRFGCIVRTNTECLGAISPTSADVKVVNYADNKFTVDLNDGNDSFDKGNCTTQTEVYGGNGDDTLFAGTDITIPGDHFHGGSGSDTLSYASRTQGIVAVADGLTESGDPTGNAGYGEQDIIEADVENIIGGQGDDTLTAALDVTSKHTLTGGDGNDRLASCAGGRTTFVGGNGIDTVDYSARTHGVTVTIGDYKANDGEPGDLDNVGLDVENVIGSDYDDIITGSALANVITPRAGNDTVNGGDGDDTFMAGVSAPEGNDTYNGGKGIDTIDYSARISGGVCIVLDGKSLSGACSFTVGQSTSNVSSVDAVLVGLDVENAVGTANDDHLVGNDYSNVLIGFGGADWLEGKAGLDQLDDNVYVSNGGNTCSPITRACVGPVSDPCDCATSALSATCSSSSLLDCGGDPLDLATCANGTPDQFVGCSMTQ
jgi:Ca2+-binding RTX toxin-like protein